MATAQAIVYAGGRPVFADVGEDLTIALDLTTLLDQHPETELILPVHMYGLPCDTEAIERIAAERSRPGRPIRVVYDAAHAFGSARGGQRVGRSGDAEVFSLSVTVTSRNAALIERIRHMRNYGIEANYDAGYPGLNGKMSEFHAIVGLANMKHLEARMACRQDLAQEYAQRIHERSEYRVLGLPQDVRHTFKDFTVRVPDMIAHRREELIERLKVRGVETRAYFYPPVHEQTLFRKYADRPLPRTETLSRRVLTLPFYTLMTSDEIEYVVDELVRAHKELA
jgi:dTDP-4-amino-4,6-dideoxygalactose transaminase